MRKILLAATLIIASSTALFAQSSGTTSGPATGKPATLGTGGQTTATPHMTETLSNHGGSTVQNEQAGQAGGNVSTVKPGVSDAGAGVHVKK